MNTQANEPLTFIYTTYIRTTAEKLWEALTSPEFSEQYWSGFRISSPDWKEGSPVYITNAGFMNGGADMEGKVLKSDPPRSVTYTFDGPQPGFQNRSNGPSRVTYKLEPTGPHIKLTLIHENLLPMDVVDAPNTMRGINNGWPTIFSSLKSLLETGEALTYPELLKEFA